jgi:hypothetical protein
MRVCATSGCPALTTQRRCEPCQTRYEQARGTRQARGYDAAHDRQRKRWEPQVLAGLVDCHATRCLAPVRRILPGEPWDLGHTPDRKGWTGPEHARCNRSAGGRAGHA